MSRRRSALGVLLTSLLLSALPMSVFGQSPAPALGGTDWQLTQLAGSGVRFIEVPADVDATLRIDGTEAGGSGGCNQWFATVAVDGASVTFDQVGATLMACPEPAMSIESAWLGYLPQVASWSVTDGRLELADPNGAVLLVFAQSPAPALEGTDWELTQLAGSGVPFIEVPAGVDATLRSGGTEAGGSGGCNQWFASVAVDGASVTFDQVTSTEMACPEPAMSIESAWLGYLPQVASWSVTDGQLELADPNGAVLLVFGQSPAPALEGTE